MGARRLSKAIKRYLYSGRIDEEAYRRNPHQRSSIQPTFWHIFYLQLMIATPSIGELADGAAATGMWLDHWRERRQTENTIQSRMRMRRHAFLKHMLLYGGMLEHLFDVLARVHSALYLSSPCISQSFCALGSVHVSSCLRRRQQCNQKYNLHLLMLLSTSNWLSRQ